MIDYLTEKKRAAYSKKGGLPPARWRIEGITYTYAEIAKALGITLAAAKSRMHSLRYASGSITLERLRAIGQ